MIDELYDDVLSIMAEKGFVTWFQNNHSDKISPLRWCYGTNGTLRHPPTPPKGLTWLINSHDTILYYPYTGQIDDFGNVGPRKRG